MDVYFHTLLSKLMSQDGKSAEIFKKKKRLNNTIIQLDLTDIYRTQYPIIAPFSDTHRTFT
jgi:hypothetical protein